MQNIQPATLSCLLFTSHPWTCTPAEVKSEYLCDLKKVIPQLTRGRLLVTQRPKIASLPSTPTSYNYSNWSSRRKWPPHSPQLELEITPGLQARTESMNNTATGLPEESDPLTHPNWSLKLRLDYRQGLSLQKRSDKSLSVPKPCQIKHVSHANLHSTHLVLDHLGSLPS